MRRSKPATQPNTLETLEPRALLAVSFDTAPIPSQLPNLNLGTVQSIATADYNGDGNADLAVSFHDATSGTATPGIAFYAGNGDGSFQSPVFTALSVRAGTLIGGRFNGLPVPTGGGAELVSVGGVGGSEATGFTRSFLRVYRLDLFTRRFVVQARLAVDPIAPHTGDAAAPFIPGNPVLGQFNGRGPTDIAFPLSTGGRRGVAVVQRNSVGNLTLLSRIDTDIIAAHETVSSGVEDATLIAGDLNADGFPDLVFRTVNGYSAIRNNLSGIASTTIPIALSTGFDWRFTDIDADGRLDAISTFIPRVQADITNAVAQVRVKRGQGFGTGTAANNVFFGAIQRIGTLNIGLLDPFAAVANATNLVEREVLITGPDLNNDQRPDLFFFRDAHVDTPLAGASYQLAQSILTPAPPALPLSWPAADAAVVPVVRLDLGAVPFGRGFPVLADVNGDGRADLVQFVDSTGQLEVRLNANV